MIDDIITTIPIRKGYEFYIRKKTDHIETDHYLGTWVYVFSEDDRKKATEFLRKLEEYTLQKCPETARLISTEFIERKAGWGNLKNDTLGIKMHFFGIWSYQGLKSTGMYLGDWL